MPRLALYLFGPPPIELDGEPVHISRRKVVALLAYLAMTGTPHSRDALATLLWPERSQSRARAYLRRALSELNRALGDGVLEIDREIAGLDSNAGLWLDVDVFRQHLAQCATHGHPAAEVCDECLLPLEEAVRLYHDDFLAGFTLRDSPDFDEWQFFQSEGLRDELASVLERLTHWHGSQAEYDRAIAYARRWLALDPLQETVYRRLIELYAASGQRNAALRQYEECERLLEQKLGVLPEAQTTALYERIRTGAKEIVERARAERPGAKAVPHNLPVQSTPFVGREAELAQIAALLSDPACRLLTLVGPGGSGKTRLALQAAEARLDASVHEHGVFFVSLAPLSSAEAIVPTVADVLGFRFFGGGTPQQQLLDYLRQRNLLLIMDNYEHLLAPPVSPPVGGTEGGVQLVSDIIKTAPNVKILATSRARLNVGGEHRFQVAGMDYPDSRLETVLDATRYSAVELFTQSARRARSDFQLTGDNLSGVLDVCRLTEGMPLAIRLAASWVALLTPSEIAVEIDQNIDVLATERRDVPERQRSMRAAFDHSWTMLTEREREVTRALSVFRGGFTRESAQAVTGAALRELKALLDKSFLSRETAGRYQVHELLRQYALEKLKASPETHAEAREHHCAYYAAALEQWAGDLKGPQQQAALEEMDLEIDNARAAWNWAVAQRQVKRLGQALEGLHTFYSWRLRWEEGETACRRAADTLKQVAAGDESRVLAAITAHWAFFCRSLGNRQRANQLLDQSLALLDDLASTDRDTRHERAYVLYQMGVDAFGSDWERAKRLYKQSLDLYWELGDQYRAAVLLEELGWLAGYLGEYADAESSFRDSLALRRALGDQKSIASALIGLGTLLAGVLGHFEEGKQAMQEGIAIYRRQRDRAAVAHGLGQLVTALWPLGRYAESHSALKESAAIYADLGLQSAPEWPNVWSGFMEMHMGRYESARALGETVLSSSWELGQLDNVARALHLLGCVALVDGAYAEARAYLSDCVSTYRSFGLPNELLWALSDLAVAERGVGQASQALQHLCEGFQTGAEIGVVSTLVFALPAASLFLLDWGAEERAVTVYGLAARYGAIANSRWFQDVMGKHIAAASESLPPDVVAAAKERGRARDLWAAVEELLTELNRSSS